MRASYLSMLTTARKKKYAVPAFNIYNLEVVQGIMIAAEKLKSPVILQASEAGLAYGGMDFLGAIARVAAYTSSVPVAFHLDHGRNVAVVEKAIKSGWFDSVMIDASHLSYKENVAVTKKIVTLAHKHNVDVEAELGKIPGKEDVINETKSLYTVPEEALEFVHKTGCDALAIAVGTAHGAIKATHTIKLDTARIATINKLLKIPLVLHGASSVDPLLIKKLHEHCSDLNDCERIVHPRGIPPLQIKHAIKAGITKINIDTDLRLAFTAAMRTSLLENTHTFDPRELLTPTKEAVAEHAGKLIKLFKTL